MLMERAVVLLVRPEHITAVRVTPDVQPVRKVTTAQAVVQRQDVRQENTVMQPEVRQNQTVRAAVPVITTIVPVRRVVLTAAQVITAQADLTERHVVRVHTLQPPTPRH